MNNEYILNIRWREKNMNDNEVCDPAPFTQGTGIHSNTSHVSTIHINIRKNIKNNWRVGYGYWSWMRAGYGYKMGIEMKRQETLC
jgi:hypothetical protein